MSSHYTCVQVCYFMYMYLYLGLKCVYMNTLMALHIQLHKVINYIACGHHVIW